MKPTPSRTIVFLLCQFFSFVLFGQNDRLRLMEDISMDKVNTRQASQARIPDRERFDYGKVYYAFDTTGCPDESFHRFERYPEDVKAWAPIDLVPDRHEALYYDERFRGSRFLCYGIEKYGDIGLKYAFSNGHYGDSSMIVAIIDSGLRPNYGVEHALYTNTGEIPGNGIDDDGNGYVDDYQGYDFFYDTGSSDYLVSEENSAHGSLMASIIAGEINDTIYYDWDVNKEYPQGDPGDLGVCPNCRIMNLKEFGTGDENWIGGFGDGRSIRYAVDNGAKIILLALGSGGVVLPEAISPSGYDEDYGTRYVTLNYDPEWYEALEYAWDNDVLVFGAGDNMQVTLEPASIEKAHYNTATNHHSVIQVGNVYPGILAHHTGVSAPGRSLDIVVPGSLYVGRSNSSAGTSHGSSAGTSQASALAAGIVANFWSEHQNMTNYQVKKRVIESATDNLWNLGSDHVHHHVPTNEILDVVNPEDENGVLPRNRWGVNQPITDDIPGWDEYYGYGMLDFESLYEGVTNREVDIDVSNGSVNGYLYPTRAFLEDFSEEFQAWYSVVTDIEPGVGSEVVVYPNPAKDQVHIKMPVPVHGSTYQLVDLAGRSVATGTIENEVINLSQVKRGLYVIKIYTKDQLWEQRIILE